MEPASPQFGPESSADSSAFVPSFPHPWATVLGDRVVPADVLAAVPRDLVIAQNVLPFERVGGVLRVAMVDPDNIDVRDGVSFAAGEPVESVAASDADIRQAIARCYSEHLRTEAAVAAGSRAPLVTATEEGELSDADAPVIRTVQELIAGAIRRRASDLHLEPLRGRLRVRHRIDGVLQEAEGPPVRLHLPTISRLKIMAGLSIAEKRLPQDGRIAAEVDGRRLDLRVSSVPTIHGESLVMRVLDKESLNLGLTELGLQPDDQALFESQISGPDGMVLVTGPTGSGKTTTLYASLQHLNHPDRKIITVEDPVEYQLAGVNQVPVNSATGLTFAAALRAMLRQAPNTVMVGEIRDLETAEIALTAAVTGHMVFSTLHTNDAPSALTRLTDLGAKPFLMAAALRAVVAQRLVRRICDRCRQAYQPTKWEMGLLGVAGSTDGVPEVFRGVGCPSCQGTGYRGRLGIYEIFLVDDRIRAMLGEVITSARLREQARRQGMRTMRTDGIRKVLAGLTTIEEVVSATMSDQFQPTLNPSDA